ncbi:MAG: hypothetical protein LBJ00_09100 [Planctomycetaceae bacterium]|nr:hypothetical protein [Planctomycetaceae bacterium]
MSRFVFENNWCVRCFFVRIGCGVVFMLFAFEISAAVVCSIIGGHFFVFLAYRNFSACNVSIVLFK